VKESDHVVADDEMKLIDVFTVIIAIVIFMHVADSSV